MNRQAIQRAALAVALVVGASASFELISNAASHAHAAAPATAPAGRAAVTAPAASEFPQAAAMPNFRSIVARYGPAVVNITVEGSVKTSARAPFGGFDPDDPLFEFFRRFGPQFRAPGGEQLIRGQGSGFIVSADGIVLTNAHVVAEAAQVTVKLTDKREFKARVIGIDKPSDVAVLRIDAKDLPTIPLGDPASAEVGDWVLAIGAPFGFENSVTAGIVSAKSRTLPDEGFMPFIQTDVAINPGNSGGPLLNLAGEVIGINSQIYSRSGGYQGLSFAIPIDLAAQVKDQLLANGKVSRGRLGVGIQPLDQALAKSFGLDRPRGALVSQVEKGSPAEKAGLQAGDVILGVNGKALADSSELPIRIAGMAPGQAARLDLWRDGKARQVEVTIGAQKPEKVASAADPGVEHGKLGVAVRALTAEERKQADAGGLLVVEASGPAARAGIRPGDVIVSINGRHLDSVDELKRQVAAAGSNVALLIERDGARVFVPIELG
jgi:serine protease Do